MMDSETGRSKGYGFISVSEAFVFCSAAVCHFVHSDLVTL